MTLDDLIRTLEQALATGRIGTPVAVRCHLVERTDASSIGASKLVIRCSRLLALTERLLSQRSVWMMSRVHSEGHDLHALARFDRGATGVVTIGLVPEGESRLELFLVGNHGTVRLEGGEHFDTASLAEP